MGGSTGTGCLSILGLKTVIREARTSLEDQWYKPYDINMFKSRIHVTENGTYHIDHLGLLRTEPKSDAQECFVGAVAGMDQPNYERAIRMIESGANSADLIQLLANVGRKPREGLYLAIAIEFRDSEKRKVAGLLGGQIINSRKETGCTK